MLERNEQMRQRVAKIARARERGEVAYPNDFKPSLTCAEAYAWFLDADHPARLSPFGAETGAENVRLAGRVMAINVKGKVAFLRIQDRSAIQVLARRVEENGLRVSAGMEPRAADAPTFQLFFQRDAAPDAFDALVANSDTAVDIGDVIGAEGPMFRTRMGEPSLHVRTLRVLTKAIRPLPEKWHGLQDKETRFRQRYVDLIVNENVKDIFIKRSLAIRAMRAFFDARDYLEVETPMMHAIAGGAAARPFVTHHNALNMSLFLRIAPELYLKRLVVGGLERVYEINRNFRNEGLSQRHNPEFTMLEFYEAYATHEDLMHRVEELIVHVADTVLGTRHVQFGGRDISLEPPFRRVTIREGLRDWAHLDDATIDSQADMLRVARERGLDAKDGTGLGKLQLEVFEQAAEPLLVEPTFVTAFPAEVSPLSRRNDAQPSLVDRFELYIGGFEVANAFSELNDPVDQYERFAAQVAERARGDDEAMPMDLDYVRALEYGMPPTAGCGVGIDRLTMLLTNTESIREVILFPLMRPEETRTQGSGI